VKTNINSHIFPVDPSICCNWPFKCLDALINIRCGIFISTLSSVHYLHKCMGTFCFNHGIMSYNRFISNMSLSQLMNVLCLPVVSALYARALFFKASGRAKPPGICPGGNGSLCRGLSCLLPSEDHLFRIAVFIFCLL
jgi:hypothetical protein